MKMHVTEPLDWEVFNDLLDRIEFELLQYKKVCDRKNCDYEVQEINKAKYLVMMAVSGYFGVRAGDALKLQWKQVLDKGPDDPIVIYEQKTRKDKVIPGLHPRLGRMIALAYSIVQPVSKEVPILHNYALEPIHVSSWNRILKRLFQDYGIEVPQASSHVLRKTFAWEVYRHHGSDHDALLLTRDLLNHRNTRDTLTYLGITKQKKREAYLSL